MSSLGGTWHSQPWLAHQSQRPVILIRLTRNCGLDQELTLIFFFWWYFSWIEEEFGEEEFGVKFLPVQIKQSICQVGSMVFLFFHSQF